MTTSRTHDHEIEIDSTKYRLDLIRDDSGVAMYKVEEKVASYQDPLEFAQIDWKGGMGQSDFIEKDRWMSGYNIDTTIDGKVILGPLATEALESDATDMPGHPTELFRVGGGYLIGYFGTKIYWYDEAGAGGHLGEWIIATSHPTAAVNQITKFGTYLFASNTAADEYSYSIDNGDNWVESTLADDQANAFCVAPDPTGTTNNLWKGYLHSLSRNSSGINGGTEWDQAATIGDYSTGTISNIVYFNDKLYIFKTAGIFIYLASGAVQQLLPELKTTNSQYNGAFTTIYKGSLYFNNMDKIGTVTSYDAYDMITPLNYSEDIGETGYVCGLTSDNDFLYVAYNQYRDHYVYIYKGRQVDRGDAGYRWEWCPIHRYAVTTPATYNVPRKIPILVDENSTNSTRGRYLWFDDGTNASYMYLSNNPLADYRSKFCSQGLLRMSYTYGSHPYNQKLYQQLITETLGCSTYTAPGATITDGTGTCAGSPVALAAGVNTITVTVAGNFVVALPTGAYGYAVSGGTALVTSHNRYGQSPYLLSPGNNTIAVAPAGAISIYVTNSSVTPSYYATSAKDIGLTATGTLSGAIKTNGINRTYFTSPVAVDSASFQVQLDTDTPYMTPQVLIFEAKGTEKPTVVRVHECTYTIGNSPSKMVDTLRALMRTARTTTTLVKFADLRYSQSTVAGGGFVYVVAEPGTPTEVEVRHDKGRQPELGIRVRWREVDYA